MDMLANFMLRGIDKNMQYNMRHTHISLSLSLSLSKLSVTLSLSQNLETLSETVSLSLYTHSLSLLYSLLSLFSHTHPLSLSLLFGFNFLFFKLNRTAAAAAVAGVAEGEEGMASSLPAVRGEGVLSKAPQVAMFDHLTPATTSGRGKGAGALGPASVGADEVETRARSKSVVTASVAAYQQQLMTTATTVGRLPRTNRQADTSELARTTQFQRFLRQHVPASGVEMDAEAAREAPAVDAADNTTASANLTVALHNNPHLAQPLISQLRDYQAATMLKIEHYKQQQLDMLTRLQRHLLMEVQAMLHDEENATNPSALGAAASVPPEVLCIAYECAANAVDAGCTEALSDLVGQAVVARASRRHQDGLFVANANVERMLRNIRLDGSLTEPSDDGLLTASSAGSLRSRTASTSMRLMADQEVVAAPNARALLLEAMLADDHDDVPSDAEIHIDDDEEEVAQASAAAGAEPTDAELNALLSRSQPVHISATALRRRSVGVTQLKNDCILKHKSSWVWPILFIAFCAPHGFKWGKHNEKLRGNTTATMEGDREHLAAIQKEKLELDREIQALRDEIASIVFELEEIAEQEDQQKGSPEQAQALRDVKKAFNEKAAEGVDLAIQHGIIPEETPAAVAAFLLTTPGLDKAKIGDFLGEHVPFNLDVLKEFCSLHDFTHVTFDGALRRFLWSFRLPGESQKIDRMMESFATRYHECNPNQFRMSDTAYVLAFATIMLNTSLHNPSIKDRMTLEQFLSMNRGIDAGEDLPAEFLTIIYDNIKAEKFQIPDEGKGLDVFVNSEKSGWLTKEGGRARTWKRRWFILSNSCLYYFEDPESATPKGTIPLESLTVYEDPKKQFCFIIGPDKHEGASPMNVKAAKVKSGKLVQGRHTSYRICAADEESMQSWIRAIRAAMTKDPLSELFKAKKLHVKSPMA
ncbi:uncharacterized protein MONBRDRAFT_32629 [Monosiga brevicollis MX1]|uniref:SEC7 domain-containing protein n=1 Tax=Monosiga brevicollis TaxID=81824 RepID=A9V0S6_MONBE|nr:uncharacterized protein MONBRDRAFT_32629 [Monosiga brevicollis MX1]EDQ88687.1 predicted protein [Monosiga brevicollis MX1]|eukprot:XP_001746300.1 hypothetical protein [Monosiga brevicollis MX1]